MDFEQLTAQPRALTTVELLENIFSHAETEDIIRCQRVCKNWLACILASPKLKEQRFLTPTATRTRISFGYATSVAGRNADGSRNVEEVPVSEFVALTAPKSEDLDEAILTRLHPLLSDLPNQLSHHHISTKHANVTHLLEYANGEWLGAYASQPPVQGIWVTCIVYDSPPRSYFQHEHRISNTSGVRLRDIRNQLQAAVERNHQYEQSTKLLKPPHYTGDDCSKGPVDDGYAETHNEALRLVAPLDWTDRQNVLAAAGAGTVTLAIEIPGRITENALWTRLARGDIGTEHFEAMMAD